MPQGRERSGESWSFLSVVVLGTYLLPPPISSFLLRGAFQPAFSRSNNAKVRWHVWTWKRIHVALPGCHGNSRRSIKAASPDKTSAQRPPALMSSYILASLWRELRDWCLGPPTWHMIEENCWKQKPTTNVGLNCGENAQNCFRVPFFWWGGMRASVRVETEVWQRAGWVIGLLKVTVLHANTRTHEYTHVHWHTTNWPEERRCFQKINIWKLFLDQTKSSSPMFASTLFFVFSLTRLNGLNQVLTVANCHNRRKTYMLVICVFSRIPRKKKKKGKWIAITKKSFNTWRLCLPNSNALIHSFLEFYLFFG